ncbi:hypothetical protein [Aggregatibacter actinomycetemcomitans]|uniref:hypothetical protein n=1 Tax=Aggregatibacter actinomycetemcomitans TaxID=714 RepID=UPI002150AD06|nr:hypothetical protein [Aggregatibacter actinomycetemcomitans]
MEDWRLVQLNNMNKFLLVFFISLFFIFSCGNKTKNLENEYLGTGNLNKLYEKNIILPGDSVTKSSLRINMFPDNSGLTWKVNDNPFSIPPIITKDYNNITIKGRPKNIGEIYIDFSWTTYGTNISTGRKFQKRYILKVEE